MKSTPSAGPWSVERLLEAVEQLAPAERREFQRRLAARQSKNGGSRSKPDEAALIRSAQARLPAEAERRLRKLTGRSERGQLTAKESAEYQALAQDALQIDVVRVTALAELVRAWSTINRGKTSNTGGGWKSGDA
jgi:hypothetical protein